VHKYLCHVCMYIASGGNECGYNYIPIMIAIVKRNAKNIIDHGLLDVVQDSYTVRTNSNSLNITNKTEQPGY